MIHWRNFFATIWNKTEAQNEKKPINKQKMREFFCQFTDSICHDIKLWGIFSSTSVLFNSLGDIRDEKFYNWIIMMMINFTHLEKILAILPLFFCLKFTTTSKTRKTRSEKRKSSTLREKGNGTLLINFSLFSLHPYISRINSKVFNHQMEKFFFN